MRPTLLLLLTIILLPKLSFCQHIYIEPFAGYQLDLNNSKNKLLNTGIQAAFVARKRKYELLLQLQRSRPHQSSNTDSSFTVNPSLPLYAPAQKMISVSSFSVAIGHRIKLAGRKTNNSLFIKGFTGITSQKNTVSYQYDKTNYIILNPDQGFQHAGVYVSGGFEYMRKFENSRLFVELNFASPPSGTVKYPQSSYFMAPVSFNVGYSIQIK